MYWNGRKRNKITNTYFYNEDAGNVMVGLAKEKQRIDTVFMDHPRAGSDEKFLSALVQLAPRQVIYISCNPLTQERDVRYLDKHGYRVMEIQLVDMLPQMGHVECCCENTTERFLVIIEFTHFASFYNFSTKGDDFKNKEIIQGIKVRVAI